jgi:DNA ligase (NAD+)
MDKSSEIKDLIKQLNDYSYRYYVLDDPKISDKEYDALYDKLVNLENETKIILPYSPTQRVGDIVLQKFNKYKHKAKLWSLGKAQNIGELKDFCDKCERFALEYNSVNEDKLPNVSYILTKKFDGLTINLTYDDNGILINGATRGTGVVGEEVTPQIKTIMSIPLKIENDFPFEIHGEAIMTKEAFENYNKTSDNPLKNLRNGAAGALRNLDVRETVKRNLSSFFYDIGYTENHQFKSYTEMMKFIKDKGFPVDDYLKKCRSYDEILKEIEYIDGLRDTLNYDIDGVVIVIDDIRTRELLGYTVKAPKWAIAYKFEAIEATTYLNDVLWNVGRSGRVSPTGLLEPVEIGGATVKKATLNNMEDINRKMVRIGSKVFIRRSNDVIPEIMGIAEENSENTKEIKEPEFCPACGSYLIKEGPNLFCENTLSCKPQLVKSIVHFGSREAMNIEGFSGKTAELLFDNINIKSISDLYRIKKEQLLNLPKFKDKKADNLINAIENSKNCALTSFVYALGIPNVGLKTAADIVKNFKSLTNIKNAALEDLISIQDIGDIVAESILSYFKDENILNTIDELFSLGVNPVYEEEKIEESLLSNKTIVLTGSLEKYSRNEMKEKLAALGANISSQVSKKTDYVIAGKDPGSKYDKAVELNIKILTEEEIEKIINLG